MKNRKWIQVLGFVIAVSAAFSMSCAEEGAPAETPEKAHAPDIACDEAVHDFGERSEGDMIEHTFTVKNEGDLTLSINNVRTTCGCTVANISSREIAPGDSATITARFNTRGKRGNQQKAITIESNDPDESRFNLVMKGHVSVPLSVNPPKVYMSNIDASAVVTAKVTITSGRDAVQISSPSSDTPMLVPELKELEPGKSYELDIVTRPPLTGPTVHGNVKLKSSQPGNPEIVVPVTVSIQSVLNVAPRELSLVEQENRSITRYIVVRPGKVTDYQVTEVVTPDESMKSHISNVGGNGFQVRVENIVPRKSLDGKSIVIKTTAPGMESIEVPLRVISRSGS